MNIVYLIIGVLISVKCQNQTFVPTNSWQNIEEGQMIPAGLHVRINLETGKKEAKLLDKSAETNHDSKTSVMQISKDNDDSIDVRELKKVLSNIKSDIKEDIEEANGKFRSYEEIKKEFKSLNMDVKTELEIMAQLIHEFQISIGDLKIAQPERHVNILTDLEYLVHQYDNAVEFARLDGFSTVVLVSLNQTNNPALQSQALLLLGSSTQSNPRVQMAAFEAGCVGALLKVLALEKDISLRLRGVFALSCLIRSFPQAQLKFVQEGGISVLTSLFDNPKKTNEKIRLKIVNLLSDLLLEAKAVHERSKRKEVYTSVGLETSLREQGWCWRVSDWLSRLVHWRHAVDLQEQDVDHPTVEAAADIIYSLSDSCLADYVIDIDLLNAVNHAKEFYGDLTLKELDDGVNDSYYGEILSKLRSLAAIFARNPEFKDEL